MRAVMIYAESQYYLTQFFREMQLNRDTNGSNDIENTKERNKLFSRNKPISLVTMQAIK